MNKLALQRKGNLAMDIFVRFLEDETGATAIEYGLIASLIGVSILIGLNDFGSATGNLYDKIETAIVGAIAKSQEK